MTKITGPGGSLIPLKSNMEVWVMPNPSVSRDFHNSKGTTISVTGTGRVLIAFAPDSVPLRKGIRGLYISPGFLTSVNPFTSK